MQVSVAWRNCPAVASAMADGVTPAPTGVTPSRHALRRLDATGWCGADGDRQGRPSEGGGGWPLSNLG